MLGFVQLTGGGDGHVHPAGGVTDTNVVFAGVASVKVALVATLGPLLVTTCVYVMLLFASTGTGLAEFVTDRSAQPHESIGGELVHECRVFRPLHLSIHRLSRIPSLAPDPCYNKQSLHILATK